MQQIPIILAGGKGERFWPLSRKAFPKQCLPLLSTNSMMVDTCLRFADSTEIYLIAEKMICDQFKDILPTNVNLFHEPSGKNTAPAIGLVCKFLQSRYNDCIVIIASTDHFITPLSMFKTEIQIASSFTEKVDSIVLLGTPPKYPHSGYGYIQIGVEIASKLYKTHQFIEKPSYELAETFGKNPNYLWNTGIAIGKCSVFLREITKYLPKLAASLEKIAFHNFAHNIIEEEYKILDNISISKGVFEHTNSLCILKSEIIWEDIGDFNSYSKLFELEYLSFPSVSYPISIQPLGNLIFSDKKVVIHGIQNILVVDTADVLLIINRKDSQNITEILKQIEEKYK